MLLQYKLTFHGEVWSHMRTRWKGRMISPCCRLTEPLVEEKEQQSNVPETTLPFVYYTLIVNNPNPLLFLKESLMKS